MDTPASTLAVATPSLPALRAPAGTPAASPPPAPAVADAPRVAAQGFHIDASGGSYAMVVENPGPAAVGVRGEVRFAGASPGQAKVRSFVIPYIAPLGRPGWAEALPASAAASPTRMDVMLRPLPPGDSSSTAVVVVVTGVTDATPPLATLLLTNHNAVPVRNAWLSVVAYAADGNVIGGGGRTTPDLAPHLDTQLVVPLPGVAAPPRVEGFLSFTADTRLGARP